MASLLTIKLQVDDQLCTKQYNELVVFDRNISKSNKKPIHKVDLSYNDKGNKAKRVCLSKETYENLLNNAEQLEQETLELRAKVNDYMCNSGQINGILIL
jgi:hypothetical protein